MPSVIIGHRPNVYNQPSPITIKAGHRRQHVFIIGKTGVGKSALAGNMVIQDLRNNAGVCVLDPHGDMVESLLAYVPRRRTNQVVYISPADEEFPVCLNPLAKRPDQPSHLVVSELVSAMRHLFADSWGPRSEFLLRAAAAAVMDGPDPSLLSVYRTLVDPGFRRRAVAGAQDPIIRHFWSQVFAKWSDRFAAEAVSPLVNKLGAFLSIPALRNMVGQSRSTINLQELMDSGGICLVNLATGRVGEDQARLFGSLFITQLYLTALARQSQPEEQRRDFYLYLEEAETFATDALPSMLAQARKFRLNLTLSFQYLGQMKPRVRSAALGNAGTLIAFRVGSDDADELEKELRPQFQADYLRRQQNHHTVYRLQGQGLAALPTSTTTLPPLEPRGDEADPDTIIRVSRERWARPQAAVEREIAQRWPLPGSPKKKGP